MKEVYVHTLRYHRYARGNRTSRTMFPVSYGPFRDEDAAWEWVRQSGITRSTKLLSKPATENVNVQYAHRPATPDGGPSGLADVSPQQSSSL